jgi:hypothetical protein
MAEKERKTIRVIEHKNIDYTSTGSITDLIEKNWIFGWDLENTKTQIKESKSRDGVISYFGSFADCIFVRNQSIQNYAELVALEKEYEKKYYDSSYYIPRPVKIESNLKWGIWTIVILAIPIVLATLFFSSRNAASALAGLFYLMVPIAFVITIVRVIKRILTIKAYKVDKEAYAMEGHDYEAKYAIYKDASNNYEKNKINIYQKAQELTKGDNFRLPLQVNLDFWKKTLSNLAQTSWQRG